MTGCRRRRRGIACCDVLVRRLGGKRGGGHEQLARNERAHSDAGYSGARAVLRSVDRRAILRVPCSLFGISFAHGSLLDQKPVSMEAPCAAFFLLPRFAYTNTLAHLGFCANVIPSLIEGAICQSASECDGDEASFPALGALLRALPSRTPQSGINALRTSRLRSRSPDLCAPSPSLASPRLRTLS